MLLGEDFGGRHQRHLIAGLQRLQCCKGGDHGFTGADIALDQPQHGFALTQVVGDFVAHPLLRAGRWEAQVGQVLSGQRCRLRHGRCPQRAHAFAQALLR